MHGFDLFGERGNQQLLFTVIEGQLARVGVYQLNLPGQQTEAVLQDLDRWFVQGAQVSCLPEQAAQGLAKACNGRDGLRFGAFLQPGEGLDHAVDRVFVVVNQSQVSQAFFCGGQ